MTRSNTIVLKGRSHFDEGVADAAILPGEALEVLGTGKLTPVATTAADAHKVGLLMACEDSLQGHTVLMPYAENSIVRTYTPNSGDRVQALVAVGETVDVGDFLVVVGDGDGKFMVGTAQSDAELQLQATESSGGELNEATLIECDVLQP